MTHNNYYDIMYHATYVVYIYNSYSVFHDTFMMLYILDSQLSVHNI